MAFLGGALYVSLNPDTNSYRLPRVLNWLWYGHWHFIHTADSRLNIAAAGWEWLAAPLILFTKTDRFLFLINVVSFLLLPGLVFSLFRRLKVRGRVAWWWMWILPSGWCYVFQAGSCVNDAFATVYALAAVDFALRAREKNSVTDLWWSMLAMGLLTGVKQTNIPLVLLWLIPAGAIWRLFFVRTGWTVVVALVTVLVSAVPITISNFVHYGNWMGMVPGQWKGMLTSPFWGLVGNGFIFPAQNLLPPIFPWSEAWNAKMDHFVTTPFGSHFSSFEHFGMLSRNLHGLSENNAGIGLGICLLVLVTVIATRHWKKNEAVSAGSQGGWTIRLLRYAPWGLLVLFLAKVGTYENARQFAPYYPFLFPSFLALRGEAWLVRRIWWQRLGLAIMFFTALLLVISRGRPLFPAQTIFDGLKSHYPNSHFVNRIAFAFDVRSAFGDDFKRWIDLNLPPEERVVGFGSVSCTLEPQIWLPFGHRAVARISPQDTAADLRGRGLHDVLVDENYLSVVNLGIDEWAKRMEAERVGEFEYQLVANQPPEKIYLVRLREPQVTGADENPRHP
jgi:hypothetical protein